MDAGLWPEESVAGPRERRVLLNEMIACRPAPPERCSACGVRTCDPEADGWRYTLDEAGFVPWCSPCAERGLAG